MYLRWVDIFRVLLWVSVVAIVLPLIVFSVQLLGGALVSETQWLALGHTQGPWRGTLWGFTIFFPLLVLAPVVVVLAVFFAIRDRRLRPAIGGLGLIGLYAAAMLIQLETVGWLIL